MKVFTYFWYTSPVVGLVILILIILKFCRCTSRALNKGANWFLLLAGKLYIIYASVLATNKHSGTYCCTKLVTSSTLQSIFLVMNNWKLPVSTEMLWDELSSLLCSIPSALFKYYLCSNYKSIIVKYFTCYVNVFIRSRISKLCDISEL